MAKSLSMIYAVAKAAYQKAQEDPKLSLQDALIKALIEHDVDSVNEIQTIIWLLNYLVLFSRLKKDPRPQSVVFKPVNFTSVMKAYSREVERIKAEKLRTGYRILATANTGTVKMGRHVIGVADVEQPQDDKRHIWEAYDRYLRESFYPHESKELVRKIASEFQFVEKWAQDHHPNDILKMIDRAISNYETSLRDVSVYLEKTVDELKFYAQKMSELALSELYIGRVPDYDPIYTAMLQFFGKQVRQEVPEKYVDFPEAKFGTVRWLIEYITDYAKNKGLLIDEYVPGTLTGPIVLDIDENETFWKYFRKWMALADRLFKLLDKKRELLNSRIRPIAEGYKDEIRRILDASRKV